MFHLVPSQVMRKYLEEEHWLFTDWQKATLIWNSPIHTKTEILEALKELADTTADTILKRQILERLTYEEKAYRLLNDNSQGKYVYLLRIDDCIRGVFADYETARRYGSKKCEEEEEMIYTVEKQLIYGESTKQDVAIPRFSPHNILQPELPSREECIGISSGDSMHKAGGECLTWDSCEISAEEEEQVDSQRKDRFEYQFFRIPFGMEAGTIVRYKSTFTELPEYGILLTGASDWQQYMNHMEVVEWKDFLDIQVEVVFLREQKQGAIPLPESSTDIRSATEGNEKRRKDMHYVIGDIHNDLKKLKQILKQINITRDDELIVLGDVFDRGGENADPFGVYCALAGLQGKCSWIRGNHDDWLANYTYEYFNTPEKKRHKLAPYGYNSFELLRQRITEVDMRNIADLIKGLPLQKELELEGKKYLFAHAMTSHPDVREDDRYYMRGTMDIDCFFFEGIDGYISMCGHTPTDSIVWKKDRRYLDEPGNSIWHNDRHNVYLLDCGCGFAGGRLACLCLETKERFYA